jgi:hypothetical protein
MENLEKHEVVFISAKRGKAKCQPDPNFPNGMIAEARIPGLAHCYVKIPYPSPEIGWVHIRCKECDVTMLLTVAGRADDPVAAAVTCDKDRQGQFRTISMKMIRNELPSLQEPKVEGS